MKKQIAMIFVTFCLSGCVSTSTVSTLIPENTTNFPAAPHLKQSVAVKTIGDGGVFKAQISDTSLAQALEETLRQNDMLAQDTPSKLTIIPSLLHLKQPAFGGNMKVTSQVNYIVKTPRNKVIMDETISADYTANLSEAFVGVTRVRLANEGSVRENIKQFMDKLIEQTSESGF